MENILSANLFITQKIDTVDKVFDNLFKFKNRSEFINSLG